MTPLVHCATTSSGPEAINIGEAMTGTRKLARHDRSRIAPSPPKPDSNIPKTLKNLTFIGATPTAIPACIARLDAQPVTRAVYNAVRLLHCCPKG